MLNGFASPLYSLGGQLLARERDASRFSDEAHVLCDLLVQLQVRDVQYLEDETQKRAYP